MTTEHDSSDPDARDFPHSRGHSTDPESRTEDVNASAHISSTETHWVPTESLGQQRTSIVGNLFRGGAIGVVETVPGVSGGTVALVVGIYTQLIDSASHVVSALRRLVTGPHRRQQAAKHLRLVDWKLIVPVFVGMAVALFTVAGPVANLYDTYPEFMRAAFFGMVLASISIPLRMAGVSGIRWPHVFAGVAGAALAFYLVSLPPTQIDPSPIVLVLAAAVAVSALLLPGLSGSFLLITFGLYEPTLRAVDELDFAYLGTFTLGLLLGVVSIVKGLEWLLRHRRRITLVVLTGVMLGAMRTLWPWQSENRELLPPESDWPVALSLAVAGAVLVTMLVIVSSWLDRRQRLY